MFMTCCHTRFSMSVSDALLIIAIEAETKCGLYSAVTLLIYFLREYVLPKQKLDIFQKFLALRRRTLRSVPLASFQSQKLQ
jgi:hypothetical protein